MKNPSCNVSDNSKVFNYPFVGWLTEGGKPAFHFLKLNGERGSAVKQIVFKD